MNNIAKRIVKILLLFCIMYLGLIFHLSYIEVFKADEIKKNPYNKRLWIKEDNIIRGTIFDRNKIIVGSTNKDNKEIREYPFKNAYAHIIGYSYKEYGKAALEKSFNPVLLGIDKSALEKVRDKIVDKKNSGYNIILTIDNTMQNYASTRLNGKKGAAIVMNPKTGEVYSLVSKPDFNPNDIVKDWKTIADDEKSPLLNRATSGLYAPGSVFKLITATGALNNKLQIKYFCEGQTTIDGFVLKDYKNISHKEVDMEKALTYSCNVAFAHMGLDLGYDKMNKVANKFMLNKEIPFDIYNKKSIFPQNENMSEVELASSSIGQGKVLMTPLNMAIVVSAIGNDGDIMRPYLVKAITDNKNRIIDEIRPKRLASVMTGENATILKDMMVKVVKYGTGKRASIAGIEVGGKTGTAQTQTKSHDWFVGFAPAKNPQFAVVVVLENEGKGGGVSAAPIAKDLLENAFNVLNNR